MKKIYILLFLLFIIFSCSKRQYFNNKKAKVIESYEEIEEIEINKKDENMYNIIKSIMEKAYMEGQKDAVEGDVRIEKYGYDYIWIKTPWDDGDNPENNLLSEYD